MKTVNSLTLLIVVIVFMLFLQKSNAQRVVYQEGNPCDTHEQIRPTVRAVPAGTHFECNPNIIIDREGRFGNCSEENHNRCAVVVETSYRTLDLVLVGLVIGIIGLILGLLLSRNRSTGHSRIHHHSTTNHYYLGDTLIGK
jgi:preprotein translocase subunit SecG